MKNKILSISAAVVAAALCVFSICFSFAVPQTDGENFFSQLDGFRYFIFGRPYDTYGDYGTYNYYNGYEESSDESNFDVHTLPGFDYDYYFDEENAFEENYAHLTSADWINIYSQTCISYIYSNKALLEGIDTIFINSDEFEHATAADKEEIKKIIKNKIGFAVSDVATEQSDAQNYLQIHLYYFSYGLYELSILGLSERGSDGITTGSLSTSWGHDDANSLTLSECLIWDFQKNDWAVSDCDKHTHYSAHRREDL